MRSSSMTAQVSGQMLVAMIMPYDFMYSQALDLQGGHQVVNAEILRQYEYEEFTCFGGLHVVKTSVRASVCLAAPRQHL